MRHHRRKLRRGGGAEDLYTLLRQFYFTQNQMFLFVLANGTGPLYENDYLWASDRCQHFSKHHVYIMQLHLIYPEWNIFLSNHKIHNQPFHLLQRIWNRFIREVQTYLRMFGCDILFISCTSLRTLGLFPSFVFILSTITSPVTICVTCKCYNKHWE